MSVIEIHIQKGHDEMTANDSQNEVRKQYEIPQVNLDQLERKIAQLNKVADKVGAEPVQMTIVETTTKEIKKGNVWTDLWTERKTEIIEIVIVEISGQAPKFDGWTFAGTLEHLETGNIVRGIQGFEIPEMYRTTPPVCDHCQTNRKRNDTYLVVSDDGEWKQVGKSCLKDFTGHSSPQKLAAIAEFLADLDLVVENIISDGAGRVEFMADPIRVLAITSAAIRLWGWTSKSKSDEGNPATADTVGSWVIDSREKNDKWFSAKGKPISNRNGDPAETNEADYDLAKNALQWANELTDLGNDYLWNVHQVAQAPGWTYRQFGIGASIIPAYKKAMEKAAEREREQAQGRESQHVGEIKKRQQFDGLELVKVIGTPGYYGTTWIHKFIDPNGNHLVWFSSSVALDDGLTYSGKATVKDHNDYQGIPQTVLTRCSFEAVE